MNPREIVTSSTPDSHLQNPIRFSNRNLLSRGLQFIEMNKIRLSKDHKNLDILLRNFDKSIPLYIAELALKCPYHNHQVAVDSERIYGIIFSDVYNKDYKISNYIRKLLPNVWRNVQNHIKNHKPFKNIKLKTEEISLTDNIMTLYSLKQNWELVRLRMQKKRINKDTNWSVLDHDVSLYYDKIYVSQHYIILSNKDEEDKWIMDYDQVMMMCDTIIARIFSIMYLNTTPNNMKYKFSTDILITIYKSWDDLFGNYGNDTFKIIKNWEPIIQGILLQNHDPLKISSEFLTSIVTDCEETFKPYMEKQVKYLLESNLNEYQLSELHGIYRHWGHPTVDEVAGCNKVRKIAKSRSFPNPKMMKKAKGIFARHFCISFIHNHSKWPRINLSKFKTSSPLYKVIKYNIININFFSPRFSIYEWENVEFIKEFEFDYHIDYLDVCDDKAISPYLNELPTIYAKESLGWDPGKPTSSRRVLIEIMRREGISPIEICKKIMDRKIPDNWKIILVHAKERELKIEPRLFAMFVIEMRIYYCITEANISKTIFKYFPQQTMTLSENELTKRLYSMADDDFADLALPIFMSIDFKSWNIHWQYITTYETFKHIDDLFGTPGLYTYSHIFFQEAVVAISSRFNPPNFLKNSNKRGWIKDLKEDDLLWKNHLGGFEGIRQKGWTIVTILLLLIVELKTGIKSYIIGQGDNQFLKLMLPIDKDVKYNTKNSYIQANQDKITKLLKSYLHILSQTAKGFNLVIKTEESWFSSCIINYGKDILVNGAYMSQGLKRISRVMPDINDLYPTLSKNITSLQTTGLATAQKSYDTWGPYFICSVETLLTINREIRMSLISGINHIKRYRSWIESDHGMSFLLHGDTNCTAVPILNLNNYLYRGHPDPLTAYLTVLTENFCHCITCKNILVWLIRHKFKLGKGDPELLINDPLSLNIDSPPQVAQIFKNEIMRKVKKIVKNPDLKEIFRIDSDKEDSEIYDFLLSTEPFYPRLCHEIILQTVTGTREYIISKFSSARTTQQLLNNEELKLFYRKIILSEEKLLYYWVTTSFQISIASSGYSLKDKLCPTAIASDLRNYTWKNALDGKLINGVTIPFPLHQFCISSAIDLDHNNCTGEDEYILYTVYNEIKSDLTHTRGPYQPYYGHKTRERQSGKIYQIPCISRPLQASERLIQLYQWCLLNDNHMTDFITSLISTRTNVPLDVLELCTNNISSGSQFHRLNDHFTKRGVLLNTRPNTSSHVYVSTDNMGKYSRGSDNMNMHYQGSLLVGLTYIHNIVVEGGVEYGTIYHQHYYCKQCEEYVPDTKVYSNNTPPNIRRYSENPLIYKRIEDFPSFHSPKSMTFKMIRDGNPSMAMAHIIFSRILKNMNNKVWGISQRNKVYSTKISVKTIIEVGVDSVLMDLAILIYLYFQSDVSHIIQVLCIYQREIWQDLGPACLMPENLSILYYITNQSYQAQLYESPIGVYRLLSKGLSLRIKDIEKHGIDPNKRVIFYTIKGLSITKIFNMWSYLLFIKSKGTVDLRKVCRNISSEDSQMTNMPSKNDLDMIDNTIQNYPSKEYALYAWNLSPLYLSKVTPENALGFRTIAKQHIPKTEKVGLGSIRAITYLNTSFIKYLELPLIEKSLNEFDGLFLDDSISLPIRRYQDHAYHLYHNLSSGFVKILQIIIYLKIQNVINPICLADGEGSIALLIYKLFNTPVIFNTKFDRSRAIAHRSINAIPAEFTNHREGVLLYELNVLYGGDLLDDKYINVFLSKLPNKSSLITFDAESPTVFTSLEQYKLCINVLKVCMQTSCDLLIYKFYINSTFCTKIIVSLLNTVYQQIIITVPTYSSNESYEVYAICTMYHPLTNQDNIGKLVTHLGTSSNQALTKLVDERIIDVPHQSTSDIWIELMKTCKKLGFNNSKQHHLGRLSDYNITIKDGNSLVDMLNQALNDVSTMITKEWNGLFKMNKGIFLGSDEKMMTSCSTSSHKMLDNLLTWKCNFIILSNMINHKSMNFILSNINAIFSVDASIYTQDKLIYDFKTNYRTLNRNYLRSIWVVWGHHIYNI